MDYTNELTPGNDAAAPVQPAPVDFSHELAVPASVTAAPLNTSPGTLTNTETGLVNGIMGLPAVPDALLRAGDRLGQYAAAKATGSELSYSPSPLTQWADRNLVTPDDQQAATSNMLKANGLAPYTPETQAGRVYQNVVSVLPSAALSGGMAPAATTANVLANAGKAAVVGAAGATGGGVAHEMYPDSPVAPVVGTFLGSGGVAAMGAGTNALQTAATGGGISSARAALASDMQDLGVTVPNTAISNSLPVKIANGMAARAPFGGGDPAQEQYTSQLGQAVTKLMGAPGGTPFNTDGLIKAKENLSAGYDAVASAIPGGVVPLTDDHLSNLLNIVDQAKGAVTPDNLAPLSHNVDNILKMASDDQSLTTDQFQNLTRSTSSISKLMNSPDPSVRDYAGQIKDTLYGALNDAAPDQAAALKQLNSQWKVMRSVDPLAAKAGPDGNISPALLANRVAQAYPGTSGYAYGGAGDLGTLARGAQAFPVGIRSSGTAENLRGEAALQTMGGLLGVALHGGIPDAATAAVGAMGLGAGTAMAARGTTALLNSTAYRNALLRSAQQQATSINPLLSYAAPTTAALSGSQR